MANVLKLAYQEVFWILDMFTDQISNVKIFVFISFLVNEYKLQVKVPVIPFAVPEGVRYLIGRNVVGRK